MVNPAGHKQPHLPTRRRLLRMLAAWGGSLAAAEPFRAAPSTAPDFHCDHPRLQARYDRAVRQLAGNCRRLFRFAEPVLIEGGRYPGIWLECGPMEGWFYKDFNPAIAAANHRIFLSLQRADGYLPCAIRRDRIEYSQIQMAVPIASTALELAEWLHDERLLRQAYRACARWDRWLRRYRDTRKTGLCEAFCGYDTGQDKSPRFRGLPWQCPHQDARLCPRNPRLPYLAPDLSATVYGGRLALARMAERLGRDRDAQRWRALAGFIRRAIFRWCFDRRELDFFDRDAENRFVRVRGVALLRMLEEHVPGPKLAGEIYARHIRNPREFWPPYPLPSIALDDAGYQAHPPHNCWCGPSQALTALRATRWMEHYGHAADLAHLMSQWVRALRDAPIFGQQLDPETGACTTGEDYSPAMLALVEFSARLYGVHRAGNRLEWNCRLPEGARRAEFSAGLAPGDAAEFQTARPRLLTASLPPAGGSSSSQSVLYLGRRKLFTLHGRARVVTDSRGRLFGLLGTELGSESVRLTWPSGAARQFRLQPDQYRDARDL